MENKNFMFITLIIIITLLTIFLIFEIASPTEQSDLTSNENTKTLFKYTNENESDENSISNTFGSESNVAFTNVEEQDSKSFNASFETYKKERLSAQETKSLIESVNESNNKNEHKIELKGLTVEAEINDQEEYNVSMEYDIDGYIYIIEIN